MAEPSSSLGIVSPHDKSWGFRINHSPLIIPFLINIFDKEKLLCINPTLKRGDRNTKHKWLQP
ncbi:MAG: hypothetical protein KGZ58_02190 [Ignavibacteriales bacterium]|nr:hypothetical protein [Ignavibacteriales bacterium]